MTCFPEQHMCMYLLQIALQHTSLLISIMCLYDYDKQILFLSCCRGEDVWELIGVVSFTLCIFLRVGPSSQFPGQLCMISVMKTYIDISPIFDHLGSLCQPQVSWGLGQTALSPFFAFFCISKQRGGSHSCQTQVSWGLGCARPGVYGIYTEVDRKLNDNACKVSYDVSLLEGVRCPFSLKGQSQNLFSIAQISLF